MATRKLTGKPDHPRGPSSRAMPQTHVPSTDDAATLGNREVARLLSPRVQRKSKDAAPGPQDALEQQADQAAEAVAPRAAKQVAAPPGGPPGSSAPRQSDAPGDAQAGAQNDVPSNTPALLAEDEAPRLVPGQMRKIDFLAEMRAAVYSTAEEGLKATGQTAQGCPWIEYWLTYYSGQDAAHLERAIHKFASPGQGASARDYIPAIAMRVKTGVDRYVKTGQAPSLPEATPGGGEVLGGFLGGGIAFKEREGGARAAGANPHAVQAQLGGGQPLEGGVRSRMESAFGEGFSHVRVHTGADAASLSDDFNARAFTVGNHVAFSRGEYNPGTPAGQALIAHELAHVVQQGGAVQRSSRGGAASSALEEDADTTAVQAVVSIFSGSRKGLAKVGGQALPRLKSGLQLQRCGRHDPEPSPAPEIPTTQEELGKHAAYCMIQANKGPHTKDSGIWYAAGYKGSFPDDWDEDWVYGYANSDYWERLGKKMQWRLKKGRSASAAVKAWLKGLTIAECYSTAIVSEVDSIRAAIGDKKFDERFGSEDKAVEPRLELGVNGSNALGHDQLKFVDIGTRGGIGTIGHRPAKVGEWHYFTNHPKYLLKHPGGVYQGENAILREETTADGDQLWEGLGQSKVTEKRMYNNMMADYNRPRDDWDNRAVEAIKKANHGTLPPQYDPDGGVFPDKLTTYQEILDAPEYEIKGRTRKGGFSSTAGKFLDEESVRQLKDTP